ncbi:reverse transcriptase [Gossypium australe]|uniref:Reverse transcriptase n=1 Tax=Gossypium australe TaxID=47621 RepID=A0A5B6WIR3_9ROSI|nr:reverse transcriptase [Gossypium australe]
MEIDKDEVYWEQRARQDWLKLGDKNTTFFHRCALTRKRANTISKLVTEEGKEIEEELGILNEASSFFQSLFKTKGEVDSGKALAGIERIIRQEDNVILLTPYRAEDIEIALKGMGPTKAPGPDGFPALFFQRYWHIVGDDVIKFCLGILNENQIFGDLNYTDIVLIPKVPKPSHLVNFRPISLCSVIYKIVAKTIANRLQAVIDKCIDKVQSAFVPGRLITDNVLLAYEILHTIKQKRVGKKGMMAVKLDMSKAYDRVEWKFIEEMMIKMGFASELVALISRCVTSAKYSESEGFSSLMRMARRNGLIKGIKACRQGPAVSHLLFADDYIIFGEASLIGAKEMKGILQDYEDCSRQCVNFSKSTVFFSPNTTEAVKDEVSRILGVRVVTNPERYLGLPNMIGRRKKESFQNLLDKISKRIDGWSTRMLSQGGKEVFIKSVLQAIPTFAMSCFLLPNSLCQKMEGIFAKFWWQKGNGKKGIHWCQWRHLCRPKNEGGLALLAKQGWRFLENPYSLVSRVFKAKYFPKTDFLNLQLGNKMSYAWRSIWAARGILEKGLIWKVGSGDRISIVHDGSSDNKVAELINSQTREWKREVVEDTFGADEANKILRIPLALHPHEDFRVWRDDPSGVFSVKNTYKLLQNVDPSAYAIQLIYGNFYKKLWGMDLPKKIIITIWKVSWNYIPTRLNLSLKQLTSDASCPRCGLGVESLLHLFRDCSKSVSMWSELTEIQILYDQNLDFKQWLTSSVANFSLVSSRLFYVALWVIWGERNAWIHERKCRTGKEIADFVRNYITEIDRANTKIVNSPKVQRSWKHPPLSTLKINFDGAFDVQENLSASGVVVRNSEGYVIASKSILHEKVNSAFEAEALACREAVQLGMDLQTEDVIIEGDSLTVVKKCKNVLMDRSLIVSYIFDIQQMRSGFKRIRFEFISRSGNNLAHTIATMSLKNREEFYLEMGVPIYAEEKARDDSEREPD